MFSLFCEASAAFHPRNIRRALNNTILGTLFIRWQQTLDSDVAMSVSSYVTLTNMYTHTIGTFEKHETIWTQDKREVMDTMNFDLASEDNTLKTSTSGSLPSIVSLLSSVKCQTRTSQLFLFLYMFGQGLKTSFHTPPPVLVWTTLVENRFDTVSHYFRTLFSESLTGVKAD